MDKRQKITRIEDEEFYHEPHEPTRKEELIEKTSRKGAKAQRTQSFCPIDLRIITYIIQTTEILIL
jgi:hypothetical protein